MGIEPNVAIFIQPERHVPSAFTGHVLFVVWLTAMARSNVLVELGAHFGMSYAAFCQTVDAEQLQTKCYAVDSQGSMQPCSGTSARFRGT